MFWDGDYVGHLLYVWYYVGVKSSFQHAREECEYKYIFTNFCEMGTAFLLFPNIFFFVFVKILCFRCLMFSLSGHVSCYFYFDLFYCLLDLDT